MSHAINCVHVMKIRFSLIKNGFAVKTDERLNEQVGMF